MTAERGTLQTWSWSYSKTTPSFQGIFTLTTPCLSDTLTGAGDTHAWCFVSMPTGEIYVVVISHDRLLTNTWVKFTLRMWRFTPS